MAAGAGAPVVLVRHGQTTWSRDGRHTGRSDVPLTAQGERAAALAAAPLRAWDFALVLTSPLVRAVDTCRLAGLGERAQVRDDLAEIDYGEDEGRTTAEIRAERPGWTLWRDGSPGGETLEQAGERADRVIAECRAAGGPAALFAHGHILRVLGARWAGLAAADGGRLALDTAAICVLGWERETPVIERWNDTAHLRGG